MNKFSLFTQLGMIAVAIVIVFVYIEPKVNSIRDTQDLISNYEKETQNVSQVNESLKVKVAAIDAISPEDSQALGRFVPTAIDEIAVLKDLGTIIETESISDYQIAYKGNNLASAEQGIVNEYGNVTEEYFSASFETSYPQLKSLLAKLATNDYLLQVSNLKMNRIEGGLLKVDVSLTAFTLQVTSPEVLE